MTNEKPSFSVTEIVTAVRCPRQLVLAKRGHRVVPYGDDAFGSAAHGALNAIAAGAQRDDQLRRLLGQPLPDAAMVEAALFRLALDVALKHAKKVARHVDGAELGHFADTVRRIAMMLTPLLKHASARAESGAEAVQKTLLAAEEAITIDLDDVVIRGRTDLLCRDSVTGETWVWDLKTYAGSDGAQLEQVRLYSRAYAARGIAARPALVHIARDRIVVTPAAEIRDGDDEKLRTLARHMTEWLDGTPPPPAPDLSTCRTCPARSTCWRVWNRTLPDDEDDVIPPSFMPASTPRTDDVRVAPAPVDAPSAPRRAVAVDGAGAPSPSADDSLLGPRPLWVGQNDRREPVILTSTEVVRHMAVFGAAGSGKTYLAKSIVEEAVLAGIPVLAFDVQGDILQLASPLDEVEPTLVRRRDAYREKADVRLLTPMNDSGLRISLNPLSFPSRALQPEERAIYSEGVAENLLAHVKLPPSWREHARDFLAERIRGAMARATTITIEDLVEGIMADLEVDDPILERTQRAKLAKDLRRLTIGSKSFLFQVGRPLDLEHLLAKPEGGSRTPLNILWLNGLGDQEAKESFVAMVLTDLYGWMLRQRSGEPRVLLYFDEIGPYMPPSGEPASKKMLKRIFKEGRKYGVCGLFCTQNFTDVDYKVVSQASTVAVGRINAAQEKKKAIDALGSSPTFDVYKAVDDLLQATGGRFAVKRLSEPPHWLQGRKLVTHHGATWGEDEIRAHTSDAQRRAWLSRPDSAEADPPGSADVVEG